MQTAHNPRSALPRTQKSVNSTYNVEEPENRSHYVRDVSFCEDASRIRTRPGHFARCRSFALNILRANATTNVARDLYINALNPDHALSYTVT